MHMALDSTCRATSAFSSLCPLPPLAFRPCHVPAPGPSHLCPSTRLASHWDLCSGQRWCSVRLPVLFALICGPRRAAPLPPTLLVAGAVGQ